MPWNRHDRSLLQPTRSTRGWIAAPLVVLAVSCAGNSPTPAAAGPDYGAPRFSATAPARFVRGQSVIVELVLENPSNQPVRVMRPGEGAGSLIGELVTTGMRWTIPDPMASRAAPGSESPATIPAGGRLRGAIDLTYRVLPFLNARGPKAGNTAFTLTLT